MSNELTSDATLAPRPLTAAEKDAAARYACGHATDATEARMFLQQLGLIPTRRTVRRDEYGAWRPVRKGDQ